MSFAGKCLMTFWPNGSAHCWKQDSSVSAVHVLLFCKYLSRYNLCKLVDCLPVAIMLLNFNASIGLNGIFKRMMSALAIHKLIYYVFVASSPGCPFLLIVSGVKSVSPILAQQLYGHGSRPKYTFLGHSVHVSVLSTWAIRSTQNTFYGLPPCINYPLMGCCVCLEFCTLDDLLRLSFSSSLPRLKAPVAIFGLMPAYSTRLHLDRYTVNTVFSSPCFVEDYSNDFFNWLQSIPTCSTCMRV